ncbi:Gag polyprotein [Labeo rohita]|uniref:Gag polyprotein n=1 Tax=Labeo rohita TaxID=84645 RepID=A0ABQ8L5J1_LABRO|nr:Gag polyprotein [Labeo rohita]
MDSTRGTRQQTENGLEKRHRERDYTKRFDRRIYTKEGMVVVDLSEVQDGRAEDIIKALTEKIEVTCILAVRPKLMKEYEITLECEEDTEKLADGLTIKGKICEVKKLHNRDFVVSFMHLPAYLDDDELLSKLEGWGVTPISQIRRRFYPGTCIEDGTRFLKVWFPKEVASLPYSTRMETEEGPQYFRVIHSQQVRTCRLCMSPDHIMKDCLNFKCYKCEEKGHFTRDCTAVRCLDCRMVLDKCECWMDNEQQEEDQVSGQMHGSDNEEEKQEGAERLTEKDIKTADTDDRHERTGLMQEDEETWTPMQITASLQNVLDKVEEQEWVNEEGEGADKD